MCECCMGRREGKEANKNKPNIGAKVQKAEARNNTKNAKSFDSKGTREKTVT